MSKYKFSKSYQRGMVDTLITPITPIGIVWINNCCTTQAYRRPDYGWADVREMVMVLSEVFDEEGNV